MVLLFVRGLHNLLRIPKIVRSRERINDFRSGQLNTRFTALRGTKSHRNEGWLITNTKCSLKPILPTYCRGKNPKRTLRYFKKNEYKLVR